MSSRNAGRRSAISTLAGSLTRYGRLARQVASEATRLSELRVAHASITSAKANALKELQQFDEASRSSDATVTNRLQNTRSSAKPSHSSSLISNANQGRLERIKATTELIRTKRLATKELETELEEYGHTQRAR